MEARRLIAVMDIAQWRKLREQYGDISLAALVVELGRTSC